MSIISRIFLTGDHVCPWWLAYTFDNPLRRLIHNPEKMLNKFIKEGDAVVDIGCGLGYFSIGMAKMVGVKGRVISVDLQEKMLERVRHRAQEKGLLSRITLHKCSSDKLGVNEQADFALGFWMVHEVRNKDAFFNEIVTFLKPGAHFLLVEPKIHVTEPYFRKIADIAVKAGLKQCSEEEVGLSRALLFVKA
ncbi:MAG: class I SAM-dependent methyltransferase [Proteobacteria bacterium]|nr:class I SAM-dependent methyltransferase [Pseudomonadota bacterium]MBU1398886.1 class I SAM-dependent methyltransferase [Pseudomonadota bacterium]MBU1571018.1 class I SAM-dependent methyltransferase [Pseudomonadota bacterium]